MQEAKVSNNKRNAGIKSLLFFLKSDWGGFWSSLWTSAKPDSGKQTLVDKACVKAEPVWQGQDVNILQSKIHLGYVTEQNEPINSM